MSEQQVLEEENQQEDAYQRVMSKFDRCDQCGHQAFYIANFDFGVLNFCGHHYKKNEAFIYDQALDLIDESEFI